MFLFVVNQKHRSVATSTAWDELMQKAVAEILNMELAPLILQSVGWKEKALQAMAEKQKANNLGAPRCGASGG